MSRLTNGKWQEAAYMAKRAAASLEGITMAAAPAGDGKVSRCHLLVRARECVPVSRNATGAEDDIVPFFVTNPAKATVQSGLGLIVAKLLVGNFDRPESLARTMRGSQATPPWYRARSAPPRLSSESACVPLLARPMARPMMGARSEFCAMRFWKNGVAPVCEPLGNCEIKSETSASVRSRFQRCGSERRTASPMIPEISDFAQSYVRLEAAPNCWLDTVACASLMSVAFP